jgi:hypothetical protein
MLWYDVASDFMGGETYETNFMPRKHWFELEALVPLKSPKRLRCNKCWRTLWNWHKLGLRSRVTKERVYLECRYDGGVLCTSEERYLAFLRRLNGIKA